MCSAPRADLSYLSQTPEPGTFLPRYTPALPCPAGEGEPTRLPPRYPGMVVGAEGCPHKDIGWGMVGWHKEHTAQGQALRMGGTA